MVWQTFSHSVYVALAVVPKGLTNTLFTQYIQMTTCLHQPYLGTNYIELCCTYLLCILHIDQGNSIFVSSRPSK